MTSEEFDRYLASAVESYAEAHMKAGDCEPEDALALAQADFNVMGWNHGARALYEKAGFQVTGMGMTKVLAH